jgi:hypothetical protein
MKTPLAIATVAVALLLAVATARAVVAGENLTVTGEGKCAKCALKAADKCQNVIQAEKDGAMVDYYLADNEVSKQFHAKLCKETKRVTATGMVKEHEGKWLLTASKIKLADSDY